MYTSAYASPSDIRSIEQIQNLSQLAPVSPTLRTRSAMPKVHESDMWPRAWVDIPNGDRAG